ncbi:MAG: hypothetical protein KJ818_07105, partial [Candidatus Omnitrophica bacterium]|nr:hypothetical protein [Candidatus Omnitrophota bacterium]
KGVYPDGLVSVILYGSASSGEFMDKHSNINLLVVLTDTTLKNLKKASPLINNVRFGIINPLFFTESYIAKSLDVFPIEFLDMKESYAVLYGKDCLKDLIVDPKNLRFQCEQELKSKLINIKKSYLKINNKNELKNTLFKASTSVMHILKNLLRLKLKAPAYLKEDCLDQVSKEFNRELSGLKRALEAKKKNLKFSYAEIDSLFSDFVEDLENMVSVVDEL